MDRSIVAWSIIGTFLVLCVWVDWPDDRWERAYHVAGLAFVAAPIGGVLAGFYVVNVRGRSFKDVAWGATKMTVGLIAGLAGLLGFFLVLFWLNERVSAWIAVPLVSIGYVVILVQVVKLLDYLRKLRRE